MEVNRVWKKWVCMEFIGWSDKEGNKVIVVFL